jgi:hypothetical protein
VQCLSSSRIWTPHPLSTQRVCSPPVPKSGGTHSPGVEGSIFWKTGLSLYSIIPLRIKAWQEGNLDNHNSLEPPKNLRKNSARCSVLSSCLWLFELHLSCHSGEWSSDNKNGTLSHKKNIFIELQRFLTLNRIFLTIIGRFPFEQESLPNRKMKYR